MQVRASGWTNETQVEKRVNLRVRLARAFVGDFVNQMNAKWLAAYCAESVLICVMLIMQQASKCSKFTQVAQNIVNSTHSQITCDQLVSTCVGWLNGKKLASTCVRI